jgi:metal-sulfur cluster biosynthetic enzyme/ribosomal protein L22
MTTFAEVTDITVRESQLRVTESEALAALDRVLGEPAVHARARLRFGPGRTCEQLARVLDKALQRAERCGLPADRLVLTGGTAVAAEDIVRVRRKAHGTADWISSPTSDVTIVLRPKGLVAAGQAQDEVPEAMRAAPRPQSEPESAAELAVRDALYDVIDPDLGVNIVDLGFVRRVAVGEDGFVTITMTLTSAACPLTGVMEDQIRTVLSGASPSEMDTDFAVCWEWLPSWRPADITEDGREQLRAIGFTAF